ncbi:MAG: DUF4145 domain-containing protein [Geitlerinemataceae cyanobacterium]
MKVSICKALFLGVFAGVPFSVTYWLLVGILGILNSILPKTKGVAVKFPSHDPMTIGKFASDFKVVESLLKQSVEKVGKTPFSKVSENIEYLKDKGKISIEMANSLHELRDIRNNIIHNIEINPETCNLRLLKKIKDELEVMAKK